MKENLMINKIKTWGIALAFFLYPLLAGIAFAVHPNLLSLAIEHDPLQKINEFHNNQILHFGHFLMALSALCLLVIAIHMMQKLEKKSPWLGLIGASLAVFGVFILAMDKAALCMVPSALDTLPEADFQAAVPAISAIFQYKGFLWILNLLPLLPVGFILLTLGLVRSQAIPAPSASPC